MSFKKVQSQPVKLYASIGSSDTDMRITPYPVDLDGNKLTMAALGSSPQITIDPRIANSEEIIGFTNIIDNGDDTATVLGLLRDMASSDLATPGTGKPHGSGAKIVFSWNPQDVKRVAALENDNTYTGQNVFNGFAPQTNVDPVSANDLTRLSYVQALVLGTLTTINVIVPGTAGATIAAGNLIYFDDPTNVWLLCDADTPTTVDNVLLGIAQGAGTIGNPITNGILLQGVDAHQSGLTNGVTYYASNTAGGISATPGTTSVTVGIGKTATQLYFAPRFNMQLTQNQFNALAGTSGTLPSGSNKFVDNADTSSTPSAGKVVRWNASGTVPLKFGGTGADGALTVSSGVTTIDLAGASVFVKNYSSISITGTGSIAFSNPAAGGTIIILKCSGAVTMTSSSGNVIDLRSMGGAGGVGVTGTSAGNIGSAFGKWLTYGTITGGGPGTTSNRSGGGGASASTSGTNSSSDGVGGTSPALNGSYPYYEKIFVFPGSGGGSGANNGSGGISGAGGRGAGALWIECAGALNFTTGTILATGATGGNNTAPVGSGSGGGGGGGSVVMLCNTLTASTGTITCTGGAGGTGGTANAGAGADGFGFVGLNTEFA